jgi:oxygen-independent coproporphyrinogen III oxidase
MSNTLSVDYDFALNYIENHLDKRQVNKIQHAFPSPRFWSETDVPVHEVLADRQKLNSMGLGTPINLYVGVPFCIQTDPGKCGYCLFPVEIFTGNIDLEVYFGYLKREAAMYKEALKGVGLGAVFFGGGTSNLYKEDKYFELMELVRDLFPTIPPYVDITLEGIPQLFNREKVKAIKDAGMNRISMGVQQVNERLNSFSGRKQKTKHVIQTLEWAREFGLAANIDLIFGWPQQTVATMVEDLETAISWGVYDITHYELNVGGPTDFALNRYHELPSTLSNLEMYQVARDLLKSHGFEQITAYNWRKPGDPASRPYEEGVTRRFDSMDTLGLGYAAITFFSDVALDEGHSWSYINWRDLKEYKAAVDRGKFPVENGFRHAREDFMISQMWRNLFGLEIDREGFYKAFEMDVYAEFEGVWKALEEFKFIEATPDKIKLVGDGPFYTPLVQTLLAEKRYRFLREKMVAEAQSQEIPT